MNSERKLDKISLEHRNTYIMILYCILLRMVANGGRLIKYKGSWEEPGPFLPVHHNIILFCLNAPTFSLSYFVVFQIQALTQDIKQLEDQISSAEGNIDGV